MTISKKLNPTNRYDRVSGPKIPWGYEVSDYDPYLLIPVEEMEVMYQHSSLTMGWCINCHRESNVKLKDNEYYTKIHEELSRKYGVEELTVAQMGGLECGKCHY